jgi:hypothetical protein
MENMTDFLIGLSTIMIFGSPFVFIAGLIVTAVNKTNRKIGLYMVLGSVISFIIGFGICASNFNGGGMH